MKIALITDGIYPFVLGGMQKHSYYLAKHLAKLGHQITVFHCASDDKVTYSSHFSEQELSNLEFVNIPFPELKKLPGHYLRASKRYSQSIGEYILTHNLDFDFYYTKGFSGRYLILNKQLFKAPIAVQLHGLEMFQEGGGSRQIIEKQMLKPIANKVILNADYIFTYGGKIKSILLEEGVEEAKLILQHGAADEMWLEPIEQDLANNEILFVGRYEHRKGHHLIHEIVPQLEEDFILHVVGEVPDEKKSTDDRMVYHGNKSASDILRLMKQSTFLLVPSLAEGFPTIIVEGMAQGLIPLATNVGAVTEIINDNNGIIFKSNSTIELKNTLKFALSLPEAERLRLRRNARSMVEEHFNWEHTAKQLVEDIQNCCDRWKRTNS